MRLPSWSFGLKACAVFGLLCIVGSVAANELKPFTSDGCSAFPDGTWSKQDLWLDCCTAHDLAYWQGGTYQQRLDADLALKECVQNMGETAIAYLMLLGVSIGGTPFLPSSFRWAYGWPYQRFYQALRPDELLQVQKLSPKNKALHVQQSK